MASRLQSATRRNLNRAPTAPPDVHTENGLEERVLVFAERLRRIAGTVQAKAAGWMDGDALKQELARVTKTMAKMNPPRDAASVRVRDDRTQ